MSIIEMITPISIVARGDISWQRPMIYGPFNRQQLDIFAVVHSQMYENVHEED